MTIKKLLEELTFAEEHNIKRHAAGLLKALKLSEKAELLSERIVAKSEAEREEKIQREAQEVKDGTIETIKELVEKMEDEKLTDEERDEARTELELLPLSFEEMKKYKILLSTGGPESWIEVEVEENEPVAIEFYFRDWFILPQRVELTRYEEELLLRFAEIFYFG